MELIDGARIIAGVLLFLELVGWSILFGRNMARPLPPSASPDIRRRKPLLAVILWLLPVFAITAYIALLAPRAGHAMEEVSYVCAAARDAADSS